MCYPNSTTLRFATISIFKGRGRREFSLEFVSLCEKQNPPLLLLLKKCKLSYFISYRRLKLSYTRAISVQCVSCPLMISRPQGFHLNT